MAGFNPIVSATSREQVVHALYEAAELEHCLMCTYLYAAFSLKTDEADGLSVEQLAATRRWRREMLDIAREEMGHLVSVWNITSALGAAPRLGRMNFPLDPGTLPADVVVMLKPFGPETLQHFLHLERPESSAEVDGAGFSPETRFSRMVPGPRVTPMAMDYRTVGVFYEAVASGLENLVRLHGESATFCNSPCYQLSAAEAGLASVERVQCLKTARAAFAAIVLQGEGAPSDSSGSHYQRFAAIREEYRRLSQEDPGFSPAFPAAINPVMRRPPTPEGRVWIEHPDAVAVVDAANSAYGLMLRLLGYAYALTDDDPERLLAVELAVDLMHAITCLGELAARLPAGAANPKCNAGLSFVALRDAAAISTGDDVARHFFGERFAELAQAAHRFDHLQDPRARHAFRVLQAAAAKASEGFKPERIRRAIPLALQTTAASEPPHAAPPPSLQDGVECVETDDLVLLFEARRCIHARFCVTQAPTVFLANVEGPWLHPETLPPERVVEVAHACPSGAIRYRRRDGLPDETAPPVNLASLREGGPYAFRGVLLLKGQALGYRATLCRCGASKNKPFCDGSHHEVGFDASGEPPTGNDTEMLPVRDGPLNIEPQPNGPYVVRGNLEITSGTGRMVARVRVARLCRCGASQSKPFCDGSHERIGFLAE